MKAKRKPRSNRVASDDGLGNGKFWMLYDETGTYTGHTLWPSRRIAKREKEFLDNQSNLPLDGKWRIRKVRVQVVT